MSHHHIPMIKPPRPVPAECLGMRVTRLEGLDLLVKMKRAVVCPKHRCWSGPRPAAFMLNMPGSVLLGLFASGMYEYRKGGAK